MWLTVEDHLNKTQRKKETTERLQHQQMEQKRSIGWSSGRQHYGLLQVRKPQGGEEIWPCGRCSYRTSRSSFSWKLTPSHSIHTPGQLPYTSHGISCHITGLQLTSDQKLKRWSASFVSVRALRHGSASGLVQTS